MNHSSNTWPGSRRVAMTMTRLDWRLFAAVFAALVLACSLILAAATPARADNAAKAEKLVTTLVDEGLVLLREEGLTPIQQAERFRSLFKQYFAVDAIARWVLGRHARTATDAELTEFRSLFEDLLVYGYVKRFSDYSGQVVTVENAVANNERMSTVYSKVSREGDAAVFDVAWRVGVRGDEARITDVIIENVSLATTWRSDFSSTLREEGGTVDGLLKVLRERVGALKNEFGVVG